MWIKLEDGSQVNTDHLSVIKRQTIYAAGSYCKPVDILYYQVVGIFQGDKLPRAVFADKLTFTEAQALLSEFFLYVADDTNLQDVGYLLDCIRRGVNPETLDDEISLTEQGRALLGEGTRQLDEIRTIDKNGEAR